MVALIIVFFFRRFCTEDEGKEVIFRIFLFLCCRIVISDNNGTLKTHPDEWGRGWGKTPGRSFVEVLFFLFKTLRLAVVIFKGF